MAKPRLSGSCPLFQVFDMLESVAFYRDLFGFEIHQQSPYVETPYPHIDWVWLKRDDIDLMLNTAYEAEDRPPERDPARATAHSDVCLYLGCPDVDEAFELLKAGLPDLKPPETAPYGMRQLNLRDPDGYAICLQWEA